MKMTVNEITLRKAIIESIAHCSGGAVPNQNRTLGRCIVWLTLALPVIILVALVIARTH